MLTVNYIIDKKNVKKISKGIFWLNTYIPAITKELKHNGVNVVFDKKEGFNIIHIHIPLPLAYHTIKKYKNRKPIIYHGHSTEETFTTGKTIRYFIRKGLLYFAKNSDLIICPSYSTAMYYKKHLPKKKVVTIYHGVDLNRYKQSKKKGKIFRSEYNIKKDDFVILCVGGISKRKGINDFIKISKKLPEYKFVWIGGKYSNNKLLTILTDLFNKNSKVNLNDVPENVIFTGYITDITKAYSATDIFLFPSKQETQGLALVEAAACGLPIITRDIPVFTEWLTDGKDCLTAKNVNEFIIKLKKLGKDKKLQKKLRKNVKIVIKEKHDISKNAKKIASIYKDLYEKR